MKTCIPIFRPCAKPERNFPEPPYTGSSARVNSNAQPFCRHPCRETREHLHSCRKSAPGASASTLSNPITLICQRTFHRSTLSSAFLNGYGGSIRLPSFPRHSPSENLRGCATCGMWHRTRRKAGPQSPMTPICDAAHTRTGTIQHGKQTIHASNTLSPCKTSSTSTSFPSWDFRAAQQGASRIRNSDRPFFSERTSNRLEGQSDRLNSDHSRRISDLPDPGRVIYPERRIIHTPFYHPFAVYTDESGQHEIREECCGYRSVHMVCKAEDIDGEKNGGAFAPYGTKTKITLADRTGSESRIDFYKKQTDDRVIERIGA